MSLFNKTKTDDKELSDLLGNLNSSSITDNNSDLPSHAGEFLGIENPSSPPKRKIFLKIVDRFFPGFNEVTENDQHIKNQLAKEAENLSKKTSIPTITEPSGNNELESLLRPLAKQEMSSILNNEYDQEAMFVKYERRRTLSYSVNLLISGIGAAIFLLLALTYAGPLISNLTNANYIPDSFLVNSLGLQVAQGINFVAAMFSILIAFVTLITSLSSFINNIRIGRARSLVLAVIAGCGLLFWWALIVSNYYVYSLLLIIPLFIITRRVGR